MEMKKEDIERSINRKLDMLSSNGLRLSKLVETINNPSRFPDLHKKEEKVAEMKETMKELEGKVSKYERQLVLEINDLEKKLHTL